MAFYERLKNLRKEKEIGQQELALALNISRKSISHWETGYSEPLIAQLIMLADLFDVTLDDLLGRENKSFK